MARVITFSRTFPAYHPKSGQPTYFVEKCIKSMMDKRTDWYNIDVNSIFDKDFYHSDKCIPKHHTIRSGHRWKVGDKFSPRVWSGKPYNSKQIQFAPDMEVKKTWGFEINKNGLKYINGKNYSYYGEICKNDGLEPQDFLAWFNISGCESSCAKPFSGQIICWSDKIEY